MKGKIAIGVILVFLVGLVMAAPVPASTATEDLTINAAVASRATLTLGSSAINFPDADPDETLSIPANEGAVSVTAKARTGSTGAVTLTVLAGGDLTSGSDTIAVGNVTWTAAGTGFAGGTMNKTEAQSAGSWTGPGNRTGTFSYSLANSWDYVSGSYTATATYTLTSP